MSPDQTVAALTNPTTAVTADATVAVVADSTASTPPLREMPVLCGKLESQNTLGKPIMYIPCVTEYRIGKDPHHSHVRLHYLPNLSPLHCIFTSREVKLPSSQKVFEVFLRNVSKQGTFINGERAADDEPGSRLFDGVTVTFGGTGQGFLSCIFRLFRPDTVHSHFKVVSHLGAGAAGDVYHSISRKTSRHFAIKVVKNHCMSGRLVNDGRREYEVMKNINHGNIINLRALFSDADAAYIIMDLALYDVDALVGTQGLAESSARTIARQACEGLRHIHSLGIVHRDVKPANILVFSENPPLIKLADFGLAREIRGDTALQTVCGTPLFAAPEVVLCGYSRSEHYDGKADAFSLGVTLFYMIAAKYPWNSADLVVDPVGIGFDARKIAWCDGFSDHAKDIIAMLLVRSPTDRLSIAEAIEHEWLSSVHMPAPMVRFGDPPNVASPISLGLPASILVQGQPIPVVKDTRPFGPY